jgi:Zn-dependent M28 family amino/carboxypeptidase
VDVYAGLEAGILLNVAAAAALFAGESKSIERIWADAEAGMHQSFPLRASIAISTHSRLRRLESANVVGTLEGSDPALRAEHVVLMAHLDHIGRGVPVDGDTIYNGALDNASGVAVLLEAARAIAAAPVRPGRSILFLATTAEERGLLGSRHYALNPTVLAGSIVAALNLDMPVALYPTAGYTVIGAERSTLGDMARAALEAEGLRSLPNLAPERGLFTYTDQYSFVREGIPSLYLHDGPVSSDPAIDAQQVFDDYLARHYHQVSDDTSLPIDWASLAKLAQVHARLCLAIANVPERPRWLPSDFFGRAFGAD